MAHLYIINSQHSPENLRASLDAITGLELLESKLHNLEHCLSIVFARVEAEDFTEIRAELERLECDYIFSESELRLPELVVFDMDSTLIPIEVIDELADFAGKKPEVSQVTELAMQGKLNFDQSLQQRVAHLQGLSQDVIQKLATSLEFNPGVKEFCQYLIERQSKVAIASGGFEPFAKALQQQVAFSFIRANQLEIIDQQLSGKVSNPIINATEKAKALKEWSQELGVDASKTMAVGDGANDLLMLEEAAVGLAYRAKPKVNQAANSVLKQASMAALIDLYEFVDELSN